LRVEEDPKTLNGVRPYCLLVSKGSLPNKVMSRTFPQVSGLLFVQETLDLSDRIVDFHHQLLSNRLKIITSFLRHPVDEFIDPVLRTLVSQNDLTIHHPDSTSNHPTLRNAIVAFSSPNPRGNQETGGS
jgi:hypothetical protein